MTSPPASRARADSLPGHGRLFSLGAGGRTGDKPPRIAELAPQKPVWPQASPPPPPARAVPTAPPSAAQPPPSRLMTKAPAAPLASGNGNGRLLGGAYRANGHGDGAAASPPPETQERNRRSLDAVFGRLAGDRAPTVDPKTRTGFLGLTSPTGRLR